MALVDDVRAIAGWCRKAANESGVHAIREAMDRDADTLASAADRLAYLERWLEARGLPRDWTGRLDGFRSIYVSDPGGRVLATHLPGQGGGWPGEPYDIVSWDRATPEQKAEALRIEGERKP